MPCMYVCTRAYKYFVLHKNKYEKDYSDNKGLNIYCNVISKGVII